MEANCPFVLIYIYLLNSEVEYLLLCNQAIQQIAFFCPPFLPSFLPFFLFLWFNTFIDYAPFKPISKRWLYFLGLCSMTLLLIYFVQSILYLLIPYPYLYSLSFSIGLFAFLFDLFVSFIFSIIHIAIIFSQFLLYVLTLYTICHRSSDLKSVFSERIDSFPFSV